MKKEKSPYRLSHSHLSHTAGATIQWKAAIAAPLTPLLNALSFPLYINTTSPLRRDSLPFTFYRYPCRGHMPVHCAPGQHRAQISRCIHSGAHKCEISGVAKL